MSEISAELIANVAVTFATTNIVTQNSPAGPCLEIDIKTLPLYHPDFQTQILSTAVVWASGVVSSESEDKFVYCELQDSESLSSLSVFVRDSITMSNDKISIKLQSLENIDPSRRECILSLAIHSLFHTVSPPTNARAMAQIAIQRSMANKGRKFNPLRMISNP